jgi:arsenite methyltransferase
MQNSNELKNIVKEKYGEIARKSQTSCGCGCGTKNNSTDDNTIIKDEYLSLDGYVKDADLRLGCGLPTEFANIKPGDTVVDLGSGAGNDVFVARAIVGDNGKVIGIDMTEEMIAKADWNKEKLGFKNIEFKLGDIENMPVENNIADVVVSNCVLNLVPDKEKAFSEIYRIIKPGGHFCVSDIVLKGELPEQIRKSAKMYAGCVAGAIQQDEYLGIIEKAGFKNIQIKKTKQIKLPEDLLRSILSENEIDLFHKSGVGAFSVTVSAEKL